MFFAITRNIDPLVNLVGEWLSDINIYSIIIRIFLAVLLGGIIGIERAFKKHEAGFRTNILVIKSKLVIKKFFSLLV